MVEQCFLDITVKYGNLDGTSELPITPHHRVASGSLQWNTRIVLDMSQHSTSVPLATHQHNLNSYNTDDETGS